MSTEMAELGKQREGKKFVDLFQGDIFAFDNCLKNILEMKHR
jgi:hypothetical protein